MDDQDQPMGLGWLHDLPDFRDYTVDADVIAPLLKTLNATAVPPSLPASVDLRAWCSPIENQGQLGSCTANAGVGIVEYFERRAFGNYIDASRLFLYKVTRDLMAYRIRRWTGLKPSRTSGRARAISVETAYPR